MLKGNKLATFVAFFTPLWFVSNLYGFVTEFGWGFLNYHSFIAMTIVFAFLALSSGKQAFVIPKEVTLFSSWYLLFMFVCLLSLLVVGNQSNSIDEFMGYAWGCVVGLGFVFSFKYKGMMKASGIGFFIAVALVGFFNTYEFFNPDFRVYANAVGAMDDVAVGGASRVLGLYPDQNASAYAIVFGLYILSYFISPRACLFLAIIFLIPIVAAGSRSGMLLWGLLVFLLGVTKAKGSGVDIKGLIISSSIIGLLTYSVLSGELVKQVDLAGYGNHLTNDMRERLSGNIVNQDDGSSIERKELVARAVDSFTSNPITGTGLGTFHLTDTDQIRQNRAHNTFLQLGAELGILGLLSYFLLFIIPIILKSWYGIKYAALVAAVSLFSHTILWEAWFVLCSAMAVAIIPWHQRLQRAAGHRKLNSRKSSKKKSYSRKKRKRTKRTSSESNLAEFPAK